MANLGPEACQGLWAQAEAFFFPGKGPPQSAAACFLKSKGCAASMRAVRQLLVASGFCENRIREENFKMLPRSPSVPMFWISSSFASTRRLLLP